MFLRKKSMSFFCVEFSHSGFFCWTEEMICLEDFVMFDSLIESAALLSSEFPFDSLVLSDSLSDPLSDFLLELALERWKIFFLQIPDPEDLQEYQQ